MKYLSDDINLVFNNLPNTSTDLAYTYVLKRNGLSVFNGTVFKKTSDTSISININDIAQSLHYQNLALEKPLSALNSSIASGVVDVINASLYINTSVYNSTSVDLAYVYEYPHYLTNICKGNFFSKNTTGKQLLSNMLQGQDSSYNQQVLLPKIPYISTTEYGFGTVYQMFNLSSPTLKFNGLLYGYINLNAAYNTNIYYDSLYDIYGNCFPASQLNMIDLLTLTSGVEEYGGCVWDGPVAGTVINQTGLDSSVSLCDANNQVLASGPSFTDLSVGPQEYTFTFSGDHHLAKIRIGNLPESLIINLVSGGTKYADMLMDSTRQFQFTVQMIKYSNHQYRLQNIKVLNLTADDTSYGDLCLGDHPIAHIDDCNADYYLSWIDRYGSFQSQPFNGKTVFSESLNTLKIENYKGYSRQTYWSTTPTFQINSGYISDTVYPIYESIYTSPYLLLYDTANDRSYNVILTDTSYEEKKYIRQKQLINITLNLQVNKNLTKIY